jgi:hypothetical protein
MLKGKRTKITAAILGVWSVGARALDVPVDLVEGVSGLLVAGIGWFLRAGKGN